MKDNTYESLWKRYREFQARGLNLDMSRGKPEGRQLDLSNDMIYGTEAGYLAEDGMDARNYGDPLGIPEARRLFGELLELPAEQVIVGGSSSLNLIFDALSRCVINGPLEGDTPWGRLDAPKFICPVPGYDWHFGILQTLGIEPVAVDMLPDGPDMEAVERLARDPSVKGLIVTPMYSNPSGVTISAEKVKRLAAMETGAADFRIIWDNAYCVHHLYPDRRETLQNLYEACVAAGCEDRPLLFASTSKITFAGGGIAAIGGSPRNIARQAALMKYQLVCYDKVNQLRHARFLPDRAAVERHMARHAEIIRPKFELVLKTLQRELTGIATWNEPLGGYFICFRAPKGCAKRIVALCAEAGVRLTPAGAPFIGGMDPEDSVIRIAPTYPPLEELEMVMELFPIAVKLAALEKEAGI